MFLLTDLPTREMIAQYQDEYPILEPDIMLDALSMLREASLLLRSLENYFSRHDLSQTRYLILILLDRELKQDGLLSSDLAQKLDLSKAVISKTVTTLIEQGFITAHPCSQDKRAKWLRLSEKGQAKLREVLPGYYELIQKFMKKNHTKKD